MAALPFDTLDYVRKLEAAGVPAVEAEVHARTLNEALAGSVATRSDLTNLGNAIDARFETFQNAIDARFESFRQAIDARFEGVDLRFANLESRLNASIDTVELRLGGKIEKLQWMFGVLVAMNGAIIIQLFLEH